MLLKKKKKKKKKINQSLINLIFYHDQIFDLVFKNRQESV